MLKIEKKEPKLSQALYLMNHDHKKKIVIFASGAGSNAQKIIEYFKENKTAKVVLIVCNKPGAGVVEIAKNENIPVLFVEKNKFNETGYFEEIKKYQPDILVLAGFLWKVPAILIHHFPHQIINIHPALLPSYGGKGMYGSSVHKAVVDAKEKESGITIHFVDEKYDHGETIFQAKCFLNENESPESLAAKIHQLEHEYFAKTIEKLLTEKM